MGGQPLYIPPPLRVCERIVYETIQQAPLHWKVIKTNKKYFFNWVLVQYHVVSGGLLAKYEIKYIIFGNLFLQNFFFFFCQTNTKCTMTLQKKKVHRLKLNSPTLTNAFSKHWFLIYIYIYLLTFFINILMEIFLINILRYRVTMLWVGAISPINT